MSSSGSQTSTRPPPKPKVLNPIDSNATLPARIMRSAQEIFRPYFCLIGQGRVLVQNLQVELVRPPARIRRGPSHRVSASAVGYRALGFGWIIGDSRRCRFKFFLHLLILL